MFKKKHKGKVIVLIILEFMAIALTYLLWLRMNKGEEKWIDKIIGWNIIDPEIVTNILNQGLKGVMIAIFIAICLSFIYLIFGIKISKN